MCGPGAPEPLGDLVEKHMLGVPDLLNQKLYGWSPEIYVLTNSPNDSDACESLRTEAKRKRSSSSGKMSAITGWQQRLQVTFLSIYTCYQVIAVPIINNRLKVCLELRLWMKKWQCGNTESGFQASALLEPCDHDINKLRLMCYKINDHMESTL